MNMVWMDTTALQEQLRSTLQRALGVLCMVLEVACHERLNATLAKLQQVIKSMSAKPVSLSQFTAFVRELKTVQASQGDVLADADIITVCSLNCNRYMLLLPCCSLSQLFQAFLAHVNWDRVCELLKWLTLRIAIPAMPSVTAFILCHSAFFQAMLSQCRARVPTSARGEKPITPVQDAGYVRHAC